MYFPHCRNDLHRPASRGLFAFGNSPMTTLTPAKRKIMAKQLFAGPHKSFPINDATHQRLAISGATRSERAGNISASEEASIKAKARAKLKD
jgi:hypothetical protein